MCREIPPHSTNRSIPILSVISIIIGLIFLAGVYLFLIQYAKQANDYGLMQERMAQARWEVLNVQQK